MLVKAGVVASTWAYEAGVVDEIEGVAVVWRTRLTSLKASSDQRSTFKTYIVCSISLPKLLVPGCRSRAGDGSKTYLQSISFPESASRMMRRTQGGGVIGRRS